MMLKLAQPQRKVIIRVRLERSPALLQGATRQRSLTAQHEQAERTNKKIFRPTHAASPLLGRLQKKKHPVSYTFFACANNKFPSHAQLLAPCSLGVNPQHPIYSRLLRTLSSNRSLSFRRSFISTGVEEATKEGVIALIITCVCSTFLAHTPAPPLSPLAPNCSTRR